MKCRNCVNLECDWCDMKADSPDPDMERECHWFAQKTNADRIRSMTDKELAEILHNAGGNWYSEEYWLNWLKQNAEEGE